MEIRYANHPEDFKGYNTGDIRQNFAIDTVFKKDEVNLVYSHVDRIIAGGIMPVDEKLEIPVGKELGVTHFFDRREAGIINIGGPGVILIDGTTYKMNKEDGLYVAMGAKNVQFTCDDPANPPKFYFNSCPAHHAFETKLISLEDARKVHLGDKASLNERTINQYIHPEVVESCQLVMGMTILKEGSVWNTMPCHTHERRMEVYMYFDMKADTRVFHLMGEPDETRHLVLSNEQAVISPSWSIHSGVGTSNYTFIWGMCGENIEFDDMDHVSMDELK
jgi:4-deoxy-L-threo-5-hexosulose-uronate ketol-isomerase